MKFQNKGIFTIAQRIVLGSVWMLLYNKTLVLKFYINVKYKYKSVVKKIIQAGCHQMLLLSLANMEAKLLKK